MRIEHWIYSLPLRLRSLFRRARVEQELDEELQFHIDRKAEELQAQGMPAEEARRAAIRSMDGLEQRKEECRDMRRVNALEDLIQDLRYSLRVIRKSPGFTVVSVLTLALTIGANAVVFGIVDAAILRPIRVPRVESLYGLQRGPTKNPAQSYPDYVDLRDRNRTFEALAAYGITIAGIDTGENPTRAWLYEVTGNYFEALGIQPYIGRLIRSSDEHGPNSAPYVVLSYSYWHAHFQEDPSVVGRAIKINKHPYTIIGVTPPDFTGTLLIASPDMFAPLVNRDELRGADELGTNAMTARGTRWIFMVMGHLKQGVTPAEAVADLNSIGAYLEKTYPKEDAKMTFTLARPSLHGDFLGKPLRAFVTGLALLSALILLAACANLGSLFSARAADRAREIALRLALGASRNRIVRQLLTEAVLIALAGGALGLWGSIILLRALSTWQPVPRFPLHIPVEPHADVYLIALLLAVISGILFGLVPVRQLHRVDPYQTIKSGLVGIAGRRFTLRDLLLAVQIAICAVLVTSSLVAVRGLARSLHSNFGFDPQNVLLMNINLHMAGRSAEESTLLEKRLVERVEALPGIRAVGLANKLPLSGDWSLADVFTEQTADTRPANAAASAIHYAVSPGYFRAARTALLSGRDFSQHDDKNAPQVAVVNREFARKLFGSVEAATGHYFKRRAGIRIQVIGVVEDGKYKNLPEEPEPVMFVPLEQAPSADTWLIAQCSGNPEQYAGALRAAAHELDSSLPVYTQTWAKNMDLALFGSLVATVALGILGLMGALLSITGVFGMAAYSVSKRLKELGIRMALGAQRRQVLQAALGRSFQLLAFGSAVGLVLGILASGLLALIVYQASPRDPLVLAGVVLAMLLLGLLATWIPAHRALSLNPITLLREE